MDPFSGLASRIQERTMQKDRQMFPVPADAASSGVTHVQWLAGIAMHALIMRMEGIPQAQPSTSNNMAMFFLM